MKKIPNVKWHFVPIVKFLLPTVFAVNIDCYFVYSADEVAS